MVFIFFKRVWDPFAVRDVIYTDKKKEIKEPDDFAKQRRFERDKRERVQVKKKKRKNNGYIHYSFFLGGQIQE